LNVRDGRESGVVDLGADRALYSISVTSELTGVNPQMLRVYEQKGLLAPYRTKGGTRRYSGQDVDTIGEITTLLAAGLNLAGVEHVLELRSETQRLQGELDRLRAATRQSPGDAGGTQEPRSRRRG
jgi:MerR family transcriptional regulator/heat shock protein HspR